MHQMRLRFAPSPTGNLHVGSARTAIFNWLYARRHGGKFILRIEDTDQLRSKPEYTRSILDGLSWLGLDWDEGPDKGGDYGPYFQTERLPLYREALQRLLAEGKAYPCFCSAERLDAMREQQTAAGQNTRYDRACLAIPPEEAKRRMESGEPYMIRIRIDADSPVAWDDLCKGPISIGADLLDDLVAAKSDGYPTYNFAVVVDDSGMGITHVVRGEDHIPNTPKQILIYQALGLPAPRFGHIPMILGTDRSKLSKRHGATNVVDYEAQGFLPEAFFNFLTLLGWAPPDDQEILPKEKMVELFDLGKVVSHGAVFDAEKLKWMNLQYIKMFEGEALFARCRRFLETIPGYPGEYTGEELVRLANLFRERMTVLTDIAHLAAYFFHEPDSWDAKGVATTRKTPDVAGVLAELADTLEALPAFTHDSLEQAVRELAGRRGFGAGKVIHPVRLALSGRSEGPGLFEMMEVMGAARCVRRLRAFVERRPWEEPSA